MLESSPLRRLGRRPRRTSALALALVLVAGLGAGARAARGEGLDLALYDSLLLQHTRAVDDAAQTRVDYAALRGSVEWQRLVTGLASARPDRITDRREQLAFWINVYNVLAIDVVVKHYPVSSIRDVGSLLRPVWKREAGRLGGPDGPASRAVTLDEIEHQILRGMGEPRIHAAIVCASVSCPPLRREAYRAERLDAQLDDNLASWLADPRKGSRFEPGQGPGGTLRLSPIFDWFAGDFERAGGALAFVKPHLPAATRAGLERARAAPQLAYFDYDWRLNDTSAR